MQAKALRELCRTHRRPRRVQPLDLATILCLEMPMSLTDTEKHQLTEDGFVVFEDFMTVELLAGLRQRVEQLFAEEGDQAGSEFKQEPGCRRLANLVDKG